MDQGFLRQAAVIIGAIVAILLLGTAGYMAVEGWPFLDALFMTVITVTTVGYAEVHALSGAGRVLTILVILTGFGTIAALLTRFAEFIVQGELTQAFERRRMSKKIEHLNDHYILCGYGRIGQTICEELIDQRLDIVVIEPEPALAERAKRADLCVIRGDASTDDVLIEARVSEAAGLIAATTSDSTNLVIALSARELNHKLHIIARSENPDTEGKMLRAGADVVVSPFRLSGQQIASMALLARAREGSPVQVAGSGTSVGGYHLHQHEAQQAQTGRQVRGDHQALRVVAVLRKDGVQTADPSDETRVEAGDRAILLMHVTSLAENGPGGDPDGDPLIRLVLADDHDALRRVYQKKLRAAGYDVTAVADGEEALSAIRKTKPDVAVLDVMMPGKTGYEVCREIKEDSEFCDTRVVLFSASSPNEMRKEGPAAGADVVLEKTGRSSDILEAIQKVLSRKPAEDSRD